MSRQLYFDADVRYDLMSAFFYDRRFFMTGDYLTAAKYASMPFAIPSTIFFW